MKKLVFFLFMVQGILSLSVLHAQDIPSVDLSFSMVYRNLGAFRAGAWVGCITAPDNPGETDKYTFYVGARSGGLWRTVNNGTTFTCISDTFGTSSIGAVAVAPSDPAVLWVGTGDAFNARSSYYGNGIWKSEDRGNTWQYMGLENSHHIAKIVIHPQHPNTVWVAVMGHLFSNNHERGVYKSTDGGHTWEKILYVDDETGFIDLVINPDHPDILYAASYWKKRTPWTFVPGSDKSRIYKTTDGGSTWHKLSGGLPEGPLGRIGLAIHRANPAIVYAVIQNLNLKPGATGNEPVKFDAFTDHSFDNLIGGEVYRTDDGGKSWRRINDPEKTDVSGKAAYSFNKIAVDPVDPDKAYIIGVDMYYTLDGGKTWPQWGKGKDLFMTNFGDNRCFWIDPHNPQHILLGSDGGAYATWDGGKTMMHFANLPLGEVYKVETDDAIPYNVYTGLQDHEIWKGPSNGWSGSVTQSDWVIVGMWDGMFCKVDHTDNRWLYFTTQFGKHHRVDQQTGERKDITPKAPKGKAFYRFTWTTPLIISPHDPRVLYTGGQELLRSYDRGDTWEAVSPDLTDNDPAKIAGSGHMMYCTITTISESPLKKGLIWVGTDDGHVWMTPDNGKSWKEMTEKLEALGVPADRWVSCVMASSHHPGTVYVAKSGYRRDDFHAYLVRSRDFGKTWESISGELPASPVNVVYEDPVNENLLFVGNDKGVYVSLHAGASWQPLQGNIPPAVVRDVTIQPRDHDLVVGTYGRGAWITDISALEQLTDEVLEKDFYLFDIDPKPQMNFSQQKWWGNYHETGDNHIRVPNEPDGLEIYYYFKKDDPETRAEIMVSNVTGKELFKKKISVEKGLRKIYWNTCNVVPGDYVITLSWHNRRMSRKGKVLKRWLWPVLNYRNDE
ncbi:MAG TPA: hypothetical protein ENK25_06515 [Bacteroidetes bacterium]|nr:hypothetical protein [Bacteroidota bacterium]